MRFASLRQTSHARQLYEMANDSTADYFTWSEDNTNFWVTSMPDFTARVLPLFFKVWEVFASVRRPSAQHSNYSSFARMISLYGFRRSTKYLHQHLGFPARSSAGLPSIEVRARATRIAGPPALQVFSHPAFLRGRFDLLAQIKRKRPGASKAAAAQVGAVGTCEREATGAGVVGARQRGPRLPDPQLHESGACGGRGRSRQARRA